MKVTRSITHSLIPVMHFSLANRGFNSTSSNSPLSTRLLLTASSCKLRQETRKSSFFLPHPDPERLIKDDLFHFSEKQIPPPQYQRRRYTHRACSDDASGRKGAYQTNEPIKTQPRAIIKKIEKLHCCSTKNNTENKVQTHCATE